VSSIPVVSPDEAREAWEEATGAECPTSLASALASAMDRAYTLGFQGLACKDLVSTVRRLAPQEPLVAVQLVRDWYETGIRDSAGEA
jgi:hypothetical protein